MIYIGIYDIYSCVLQVTTATIITVGATAIIIIIIGEIMIIMIIEIVEMKEEILIIIRTSVHPGIGVLTDTMDTTMGVMRALRMMTEIMQVSFMSNIHRH
jgi:hypothetical protein